MSGVPSNILAEIKAFAASEWPGDYAMQAHTIENQTEAYLRMAIYLTQLDTNNEVTSSALTKAVSEWPTDYPMQVHVFERQMESAQAFFDYSNAVVPTDIIQEIKVLAFSEWPGDYDMMLHTLEKQIEAWLVINRI